MAIAPPDKPDVDIVVVAAREANPLDALALLRYLQSVTPEIVVMIGSAWVRHFTNVDTFKDALLADRLEQLSRCGAKLYLVDPRRRTDGHIALPRGHRIEVRSDLQLRVDGHWVLFGAHDYLLRPFTRLRNWTRAWFAGVRQQPAVDTDGAFAKTVLAVAEDRRVGTVVLDLPQCLSRRIEAGDQRHLTLVSPGYWSDGQQLLEYRCGQWTPTRAQAQAVSVGQHPTAAQPKGAR